MDELGEQRRGTFVYDLISGLREHKRPITFEECLELLCPKVDEVKTKEGLRTIFRHADKQ